MESSTVAESNILAIGTTLIESSTITESVISKVILLDMASSTDTESAIVIMSLIAITSSTDTESLTLVIGITVMVSSTEAESVICCAVKVPNASSTNTESLILKVTIFRVILSSIVAVSFGGGCATKIVWSSIDTESNIDLLDICPIISSPSAESLGLYVTVIDMISSIMAESGLTFLLSEPVTTR